MKVEDLKVGMVLEVRREGTTDFCMVLPNRNGDLCASGEKDWFFLETLNDNLEEPACREIVKVWGFSCSNAAAHRLGIVDRPLLWERKPPKELTISQIEELLGYPVKIVKED